MDELVAPKIDSPYLWVPLLLLLAALDYVLPAVGAVLGRRWLLRAPGADRPQMKDGVAHYAVKRRFRVLGLMLGPLMGVFCVWTWLDARPATDWLALSLAILFFADGPWVAWRSVRTDENGITRTVCGFSRRLNWSEITSVQWRDPHSVVLRTPSRKLVIDSRYEAFEFLVKEIEDRTSRLRETPPIFRGFWTA